MQKPLCKKHGNISDSVHEIYNDFYVKKYEDCNDFCKRTMLSSMIRNFECMVFVEEIYNVGC